MRSVQYLREFIKDRLSAACEEIFSEVQKTIVHHEEEISRQRRLLEIRRKPDTNSHITDLPQQHDSAEEEGLDEQQVCNQERNSSLHQEDPEPPQIKEEQEEVCSSQEGEQLGVKKEAKSIVVWTNKERLRLLEIMWKPEIKLHRIDLQQQYLCKEPPQIKQEQEELCSSQEGEQLGLKQEFDTFMAPYGESDHSEVEPFNEQLLSHSTAEAESQDQEESQNLRKTRHSQRVGNAPVSENPSKTGTQKKPVQCDTCGKTFNSKYHLTRHLRVHTGEKPFLCNTCGKTFNSKYHLTRHLKVHTGKKPFLCNTCGKRFNGKWHLNYHRRVHSDLKQQYVCKKGEVLTDQQVCNQERNSNLYKVDPEPPQIKQEQEELCSSQEGEQLGLKEEVDTFMAPYEESDHSEVEPFNEQLLSHSTAEADCRDQEESQHLRKTRHSQRVGNAPVSENPSKTGTQKKSAQCDTCGKTFNRKSHLIRHLRVHTGEKPFPCNTCGKRFNGKWHLNYHLRVHSDHRQQYVCKKGEVLTEQQVCNQERNSNLYQVDPEPPQIKQEQEELCSSQEGEQLGLKQEFNIFMVPYGESDHSEAKPFNEQLLSHSTAEADCRDQEESQHLRKTRHSQRVGNAPVSENPSKTKTQKKPAQCDTCGKTFNSKYHLTRHLRVHTGEKPFPCNTCGKRFNGKWHLDYHRRVHSDLKQQYVCKKGEVLTEQQVCNQERNSNLYQVDPEPPQIKQEQEELCSSQEGEQLGLKQEFDIFMVPYGESDHSEVEPFNEQLLSHSTAEAESQDQEESQHLRKTRHSQRVGNAPVSENPSKTETQKNPVQCDTCGKTFNRKSHLIRHLRVHTGEKPFPCNTCGKRFSGKWHLDYHLRVHSGEKPHPCSTCGKRFNDKSALIIHLRTHTGERPYLCSTCGKRFSDKSTLRSHVKIHTGEKPHSCSICGKRFIQKSALRNHIGAHMGEKPYSCSICGKRYSQRRNVKRHMRIHDG